MNNKDKPDNQFYYIENGLIVFTEAYHLRRGYCCKSRCRHCPFDPKWGRAELPKAANPNIDNPE
jgi:hypothetical protein